MTQPELIPADRHAWDQLELAIVEHDDRSRGIDLLSFRVTCPQCQSLVAQHVFDETRAEDGEFNVYSVTDCGKCGYLHERCH